MNVTIQGLYSHKDTKFVYATVKDGSRPVVSASLDYCISYCQRDGHIIDNAQEVLEWLHKNADFVGH